MSREVIIQRIEKSDLIDAKKELMIDLVNSKKEDDFDKKVDRLYRQFSKSSTFKKHAEKMVVRDDEKLKICNMMLVMSVTLTLFFLKAVLFSSFVVNFSVDAIVGCAALVFSLINVRTKYRTLQRYDLVRDFVYLDVCGYSFKVLPDNNNLPYLHRPFRITIGALVCLSALPTVIWLCNSCY